MYFGLQWKICKQEGMAFAGHFAMIPPLRTYWSSDNLVLLGRKRSIFVFSIILIHVPLLLAGLTFHVDYDIKSRATQHHMYEEFVKSFLIEGMGGGLC